MKSCNEGTLSCFSFSCCLTLQCEVIIHSSPKKKIYQLYNIQTFKHFLLRPRPNRRHHESTWPSRPWLRSSRWSGWRYQEPKSPARHWTPGTAGHRWRWRKENIGNTGHSCNRSMYVKGKNMKTENIRKTMKDYEKGSNLLWGQAKKRLANVETDPNFGRW